MKNNILPNIIKVLIVLSLFTPLVVSSDFVFPFVFPKTAAFQILVEIMFFLWLILIMSRPEFRPKRSRIFWAITIFLSVVILASLFGVSFGLSFWSAYERMTGIVTLLHYFAYFLILVSVLKSKKDWLLVFDFFIIASLILSLFAFGQKLDIKSFVLAGEGRVSSTFGNPAYFAAYLLFVLFFTAFMFFQKQPKKWKFYYGAAFLFNLLMLYWTETRGAVLGFAISLFLFLLAIAVWPKEESKEFLMKFRQKAKKIALIALIVFVIFGFSVFLLRNTAYVRSSVTLSRMTTISLTGMDVQTRLLAWKLSLKGFAERPILGWGWENFATVFNKFYDPHLYPTENWFDRAHNIVFDTLISTGLVGLLSYLAIFGVVFWTLWRAFKRKRIDFMNMALFGILMVGYFAENFFVFDMLYSYLPFFTVLAFVAWIGKTDDIPAGQPKPAPQATKPNIFAYFSALVVFVFAVYFINIRPAAASYNCIDALKYQNLGVAKMLDGFKKSTSYGTFGRFEVRLQLFEIAKNVMAGYNSMADKQAAQDFVNFALVEGDKNVLERPFDTRYLLSIGQLNLLAAQYDPARFSRAAEILEIAQKESPDRQITLYALAEVRLKQGRSEEAISLLKKAVAVNPKATESLWNLTIFYFATADLENGQKSLAQYEQSTIITGDEYKRIAEVLANASDYQNSLIYMNKAIALAPNNADYYASLADLYRQMDDKPKAKEAALKAAELNPDMKAAADNFIKELGI
jgi:O-antigen ligase/tetratricopeptide (TPR) repeat protein